MRLSSIVCAAFIALSAGTVLAAADGITVLHTFAGGSADGSLPRAAVVSDGSALYGSTEGGGANYAGTVYRVNLDGSGYQVLRSFDVSGPDGNNTAGGLAVVNSSLYGMNAYGGANWQGTAYRMNANGGNFQVVHSFTSSTTDGGTPTSALAYDGSWLYGTTQYGGTAGWGTVFKMDVNGGGFQLLHSFNKDTDGSRPASAVTASGSYLYGMTSSGTVYRINKNNGAFTTLQSGLDGYGGVAVTDSKLYGMTLDGGDFGKGSIFSMNLDGSDLETLHSFDGGTDGRSPYNGLTLSGSTLYGVTSYGGPSDLGTVFAIDADGGGYHLLHAFVPNDPAGCNPDSDVTIVGSTLYGTAENGGLGGGVLFSMPVPEPSTIVLLIAAALPLLYRALKRRPCAA